MRATMTATMTATAAPTTRRATRTRRPARGRNWHAGDAYEPAGLVLDDPRHGRDAELVTEFDPAVYAAVAEAAPDEGLTFEGFWNVAVNHYLSTLGMTHSDLYNLAARAYLAEIGRPVPGDGEDGGDGYGG